MLLNFANYSVAGVYVQSVQVLIFNESRNFPRLLGNFPSVRKNTKL